VLVLVPTTSRYCARLDPGPASRVGLRPLPSGHDAGGARRPRAPAPGARPRRHVREGAGVRRRGAPGAGLAALGSPGLRVPRPVGNLVRIAQT